MYFLSNNVNTNKALILYKKKYEHKQKINIKQIKLPKNNENLKRKIDDKYIKKLLLSCCLFII